MKIAKKTRQISQAAIIAAIYVVMTYLTGILGLASGAVQCRFSEAMCILPAFTPAAIPGLFIGCIISNFLTGSVIIDIVFGSIATLIGALFTRFFAQKGLSPYLYPIPAIVSNTVILPFVLKYAYGLKDGVLYLVLTVGLGEIISCGILGMLLYFSLKKYSKILFD